MADIGTMQEQLQALEAQMGSSVSMVAAFDGELSRMRETMVWEYQSLTHSHTLPRTS